MGTRQQSCVFHGSRLDWWLYVAFALLGAGVLAVPIFAPGRGGVVGQVISACFTSGAIWQAWRGVRAGTVEVERNKVRAFGAVRTWRYELGATHFEARLMPLPFRRSPQVVLVADVHDSRPVVMRSINSGVRDAHRHQTWVDAMVRLLNTGPPS